MTDKKPRYRTSDATLRSHFFKFLKEKDIDLKLPNAIVMLILQDINKAMANKLIEGHEIVLPYKLGNLIIKKGECTKRNLKYGKKFSKGVEEFHPLSLETSFFPRLVWKKGLVKNNKIVVKPRFISSYKFKLPSSYRHDLFNAITKDPYRYLDL